MTTLDDLRRTLEGHATLAPDTIGLVQAAQAGAARIQRRRRVAAVAGVAVLIAVIAFGTPVAWHRRAAPVPVTPKPPATRQATEITFRLDAGAGFTVVDEGVSTKRQEFVVDGQAGTSFQAIVMAFGPDEPFNPSSRPSGPGASAEPAVVQGRPATFILFGDSRQSLMVSHPTLRWKDPSGTWLEVTQVRGGFDRATLTSLANVSRIGSPSPMKAPLRLGPLPPGLTVAGAGLTRATSYPGPFNVTLASPRTGQLDPAPAQIGMFRKTPGYPASGSGLKRAAPVNGHPAWAAGGRLELDVGACVASFTRGPGITLDQLRSLAAGTTFADCTDQSTWIPLVR
jgi:hypothetical protein